jgi:hypothetical protein
MQVHYGLISADVNDRLIIGETPKFRGKSSVLLTAESAEYKVHVYII